MKKLTLFLLILCPFIFLSCATVKKDIPSENIIVMFYGGPIGFWTGQVRAGDLNPENEGKVWMKEEDFKKKYK